MAKEKEELQVVKGLLPVVGIGTVVVVAIGLMGYSLTSRRVYAKDGYLVSVRSPFQWQDIRSFVQPDNPDVIAVCSQVGLDPWSLYDFVCRNIDYRRDVGEFWAFPSEVLAWGAADCEDTANLLTSLLRCQDIDAYTVIGDFQGYGHAWCVLEGQILETTYSRAQPVPDPEHYIPYCLFNDLEVIELWPGALEDIFSLRRNKVTKLNLMAEAIGNEVPPECPSLWLPLAVGMVMGGILGTGFAMILKKGEEAR